MLKRARKAWPRCAWAWHAGFSSCVRVLVVKDWRSLGNGAKRSIFFAATAAWNVNGPTFLGPARAALDPRHWPPSILMIGENVNPTALRCAKPLSHDPVWVSRPRNGWPTTFFLRHVLRTSDAPEATLFGEQAAAFLGGPL